MIPLKNSTRLPSTTPTRFLSSLLYRRNLAIAVHSALGGGIPSALAFCDMEMRYLCRVVSLVACSEWDDVCQRVRNLLENRTQAWKHVKPLGFIEAYNRPIVKEPNLFAPRNPQSRTSTN